MPADLETIMQLLQETRRLLDQLIRDQPDRYVDRQAYENRHGELERRQDKAEQRLDGIDARINNLHSDSMERVHEMISAMEHRLVDKIDNNEKFSLSTWVVIGIAAVGWIIGIGGMVVAILK